MAASTTTSSTQLQAHYDEIMAQTPVLPLCILPRSLATTLSDAAARLSKKAAAAATECQSCSSSQPEQQPLQLVVTTRLDFHTRAVHATAARFVCGECAAVSSSPGLLLQLLTPAAGCQHGEQQPGADGDDAEQQLQQLLLHFAAVNNAPASVTANRDSLSLWVQELACRAYSLQVVANSLAGSWQLHPAGASPLQVIQSLLRQQAKAAAAAAATPPATGGKHKKQHSVSKSAGKRPSSAQQAAAGSPAQAGTPHSKKLKQGPAAAATPASAAAAAVVQGSKKATPRSMATPQQQQPSAKKQKKHAGTPAAATPTAAAAAAAGAPRTKTKSKQATAAAAAGGLRTPQHAKK